MRSLERSLITAALVIVLMVTLSDTALASSRANQSERLLASAQQALCEGRGDRAAQLAALADRWSGKNQDAVAITTQSKKLLDLTQIQNTIEYLNSCGNATAAALYQQAIQTYPDPKAAVVAAHQLHLAGRDDLAHYLLARYASTTTDYVGYQAVEKELNGNAT